MLAAIVNVPEGDLLGKTTGLGATVGTDTGVARAAGVFVGSTVALGTHTVGLAGVMIAISVRWIGVMVGIGATSTGDDAGIYV